MHAKYKPNEFQKNGLSNEIEDLYQAMILEQLGRYGNAEEVYKTSEITKHVREKRGDNNDRRGVNYATFFYFDGTESGEITELSDQFHSEKHCWLKLCRLKPVFRALRVKKWKVGDFGGTLNPEELRIIHGAYIEAVYTERDVCSACSPLLEEILRDEAKLYWSFVYPSPDTNKFSQPAEQVGIFGLLTLQTGDASNYKKIVASNVKDARDVGNKQVKSGVKSL